MKVPLSWLKEFVEITLPVEVLAERLTLAGLEVGTIHYIGVEGADLVWEREKLLLGHLLDLLRDDRGRKSRRSHHRAKAGNRVELVDNIVPKLLSSAAFFTFEPNPDQDIIRTVRRQILLQQFGKDLARRYLGKIGNYFLARTQAEIDHRLKLFAMSGVADGFVIQFGKAAVK